MPAQFDDFDAQLQAEDVYTDYEPTEQDLADMRESWDEEMDGDFDSGMASAGWGTDEDYGDYGMDYDFGYDG